MKSCPRKVKLEKINQKIQKHEIKERINMK